MHFLLEHLFLPFRSSANTCQAGLDPVPLNAWANRDKIISYAPYIRHVIGLFMNKLIHVDLEKKNDIVDQ